jgi:predicted DNA-binding transcriptional regulator AlpA
MSNDDIKRMYDNNPMLTLKELSALTGMTVAALKRLLLS